MELAHVRKNLRSSEAGETNARPGRLSSASFIGGCLQTIDEHSGHALQHLVTKVMIALATFARPGAVAIKRFQGFVFIQNTSAFKPVTLRTAWAICESFRNGKCPTAEFGVGRVAE